MLKSDQLPNIPDFVLDSKAPLSSLLKREEVLTFHEALKFVQELPYRRISNLDHLEFVAVEKCALAVANTAFWQHLRMKITNMTLRCASFTSRFSPIFFRILKRIFKSIKLKVYWRLTAFLDTKIKSLM